MQSDTELLKRLYDRFNARDIEAALAAMHKDVMWANGLDGGHVYGHEGVRNYWTRQWTTLDPHVEPTGFSGGAGGAFDVEVHQLVRDGNRNMLSSKLVGHIVRLDDGRTKRSDTRH